MAVRWIFYFPEGRNAFVPKIHLSRHTASGLHSPGGLVSGSRLLLDMKPYLDKLRFRPLADPAVWNSAMTNGIFVRFGNVELSHDEILSMAERAH